MALSSQDVLDAVLAEYDSTDGPTSVRTVAASLDEPASRVRPVLTSLCRREFLKSVEGGYRPTVTAREFLELDLTFDDVVAIELVDE
ncbi:hypothetical protein [Halomicrobium katesii]|uniref:hypothetical protein n=1 Tax=Halomicrobium katesii TaxID=437163 RepID=UPI0003601E2B|nr:hypothetical protein [Halomicrobium katesii]